MPIYEYRCTDCQSAFELLVRGGTEVSCPKCGGHHAERTLSLTARPAAAGAAGPDLGRLGPPPGSQCCGGGCHSH